MVQNKVNYLGYESQAKRSKISRTRAFCTLKAERRILFLKNEPKKLLKTKDRSKKQTENKPETNRAKSFKTQEGRKKKAKTNRKTKRASLLKIKGRVRSNRKEQGLQCAVRAKSYPADTHMEVRGRWSWTKSTQVALKRLYCRGCFRALKTQVGRGSAALHQNVCNPKTRERLRSVLLTLLSLPNSIR